VAAAQQGDPYRYGAAGPNAFDCSGLTSYAFRQAGVAIPRTSSAQRGATRRIPAGAARPGDLVFFQSGGRVYHVGFYAGNHQVLHSPYTGTRVRKERIWTSAVSFGRVR
jgi:cell wall-associated NlpC family hydrolase